VIAGAAALEGSGFVAFLMGVAAFFAGGELLILIGSVEGGGAEAAAGSDSFVAGATSSTAGVTAGASSGMTVNRWPHLPHWACLPTMDSSAPSLMPHLGQKVCMQ
jgi:hypothetical protein